MEPPVLASKYDPSETFQTAISPSVKSVGLRYFCKLFRDRELLLEGHPVAPLFEVLPDLVDAGVVTPVPEDWILIHEPNGAAFDSTTQLAVFHRGWTAARDAGEVNE